MIYSNSYPHRSGNRKRMCEEVQVYYNPKEPTLVTYLLYVASISPPSAQCLFLVASLFIFKTLWMEPQPSMLLSVFLSSKLPLKQPISSTSDVQWFFQASLPKGSRKQPLGLKATLWSLSQQEPRFLHTSFWNSFMCATVIKYPVIQQLRDYRSRLQSIIIRKSRQQLPTASYISAIVKIKKTLMHECSLLAYVLHSYTGKKCHLGNCVASRGLGLSTSTDLRQSSTNMPAGQHDMGSSSPRYSLQVILGHVKLAKLITTPFHYESTNRWIC